MRARIRLERIGALAGTAAAAAAVVAGGAVVTGVVALSVGSAPAAAASGTWGPSAIPYRNGIVCTDGVTQTALVSWTAVAAAGPAFALGAVTGTVGGVAATPAVGAAAAGPVTAAVDPAASDPAALAYLIGTAGRASDPATVATVAAIAAGEAGGSTCLEENGVPAESSATVLSDAARFAGPYTLTITSPGGKVDLGAARTVTARVLSAAGVGVPGLTVHFATSDTDIDVASATSTTGQDGTASSVITVPSDSTDASFRLTAQMSAPTGLVELDEAGAVPLVAAAPADAVSAVRQLQVDTSAAPVVRATLGSRLALPGSSVTAQVAVTGMNGHSGTASLDAYGPLPYVDGTGCTTYDHARWAAFRATADDTQHSVVAAAVPFSGDGSVAASTLSVAGAGCYELRAQVATTNADPAVTATSRDGRPAGVLTVPPLSVDATAAGHGVGVVGAQTTTLALHGSVAASLESARGVLLGPRADDAGVCPTDGWAQAAQVGSLTAATGGGAAHSVVLTSTAVARTGCYGFRVAARIVVPGAGSLAVRVAPSGTGGTVLVLDPSVTVADIADTSITIGKSASATVAVSGSLNQKGTIQLELAHQPYTYRGCFGLTWDDASPEPLAADAPSTATTGDGTYTVASPSVPRTGCWTVEPVLVLDANSDVRVLGRPVGEVMTAFTAVPAREKGPPRDVGAHLTGSTTRFVIAGAIALGLLLATAAGIVLLVRRRVVE